MKEQNEKNVTITKADQALLERFHNADPDIQQAITTILLQEKTPGIDDRHKRLDEILNIVDDAETELIALHGTVQVLRGVREDSEFDMMDLCECFVNISLQLERINGMIENALHKGIALSNSFEPSSAKEA